MILIGFAFGLEVRIGVFANGCVVVTFAEFVGLVGTGTTPLVAAFGTFGSFVGNAMGVVAGGVDSGC